MNCQCVLIMLSALLLLSCAPGNNDKSPVSVYLSGKTNLENGVRYEFTVTNLTSRAVEFSEQGEDNWMACEYLVNGQWWSPGVASDSNIRFVELAPFASEKIDIIRSREPEVPWRMEILIENTSHGLGQGVFSCIVYPDGK